MRVARTFAVLLLLIAVAGCAHEGLSAPRADPAPGTAATESDVALDTLRRVEWQLQEFTVDGQTTDVRAAPATLRFSGDQLLIDGCNALFAAVEVADGRMRVTDLGGTEAGCPTIDFAAEQALWDLDEGWSDWQVRGEQLEITFADTTLRYAVRDAASPISPGQLLSEPRANGMTYRLSLTEGTDGPGLALQTRETGAAPPWLLSWVVAGLGPLTAVASAQLRPYTEQLDPARAGFVAGFVPAAAARVTHQADSDQAPVELALIDVGDPELTVAFGFDAFHFKGSSMVAYDAAGSVIAGWP